VERCEARSPGRVNLIGEHTDYNDGFVMPAAIGYFTSVSAARRTGRRLTLASEGFPPAAPIELDRLPRKPRGDWSDYACGVLAELEDAGVRLAAADLRVTSTIPPGAGLSSSAAFEVAVALAMLALAGAQLDRVAIAELAQRAECTFAGARVGIMDQFAVLFGRAGHAILLDTRTLRHELLALPPHTRVVICNTGVRRALAAAAYNERREQCEAAVAVLRRHFPGISALRDVSMTQLEACERELPDPLLRRARHVVAENARVLDAAAALRRADAAALGALMNASHESLRDDYEVSCAELDAMVAIARGAGGVYGARMTGGGFGGCTVNLVEASAVGPFCALVAAEYRRATGRDAAFYDGTPVDAASVA